MYTESDMSFPALRLEDAYVIPTKEFFTWDDGRTPLGDDLREATLVDRAGVVWRILGAEKVTLPRKGLLARQRYLRVYQLDRQNGMTLAEVKAAILPMIRGESFLWRQGGRVDAIATEIERAKSMSELCQAAKKLG